MDSEQISAFLLFSVAAAGTPGPSNVLLTATGSLVGILRGLPAMAGVVAGMGLMMFLVAFGLGSLVLDHPEVLRALNWAGAAFLLWLAWKIATAGQSGGDGRREPVGFLGAAAFQWVNPKSWLVTASAAGTYLAADAGSALTQSLLFALLFVIAAAPCCLLWLGFGAAMQRILRTPRAHRIFNVAMAALLAGSVVFFVT